MEAEDGEMRVAVDAMGGDHGPSVVVPGAVHSPAVEAPETTAAALVRFWNAAEKHYLDTRSSAM